jgi:hypothetical protein
LSRIWLLSAPVIVAFLAVFLLSAIQPAFTQAVLPDDIQFVNGPDLLLAGGNTYSIDFQLTLRGANYSGNNFAVYFLTSDPSLVDIPPGSSVVSGADGRASFNLTTGPGFGNVTITAALMSPDGSIRSSRTYLVTAYGNLSGTIMDNSSKGIPGATVRLYPLVNGETRFSVPDEQTAGPDGSFAFGSVPYGQYTIEADIAGNNASVNLTVSSPDQRLTVTIPGYVVPEPTPTPTPEPTVTPTEQPSPPVTPVPASPTPAGKTPTGDTTRQLFWIGGIALVLAAIIIGVQLLRQRKPKK